MSPPRKKIIILNYFPLEAHVSFETFVGHSVGDKCIYKFQSFALYVRTLLTLNDATIVTQVDEHEVVFTRNSFQFLIQAGDFSIESSLRRREP